MRAKRKLNAAYFRGGFIMAGLATGSATVFGATLAVLLLAAVMSGDIRR